MLRVGSRRHGVRCSSLMFSADQGGALRFTFDLRARGDDAPQLTLNGYLPLPTIAPGRRSKLVLDAEDSADLLLYVGEHLPLADARLGVVMLDHERMDLTLAASVHDEGRRQAVTVRARLRLGQVSVKPDAEDQARAALAAAALSPSRFVWQEMPNGLWTFYTRRQARSEIALRTLLAAIPRLSAAERLAAHASSRAYVRARRAQAATLARRFPAEVRALTPWDRAELEDSLLR